MPDLPRLPIPPLRETLNRYLARVEPLQEDRQNNKTRECVLSDDNLKMMQKLHEHLLEYDKQLAREKPQSSYIEDFWYDAYLMYEASVVLNVNPYFLLEDDRTIKNVMGCYGEYTCQVKRAAKLIFSILKFKSCTTLYNFPPHYLSPHFIFNFKISKTPLNGFSPTLVDDRK